MKTPDQIRAYFAVHPGIDERTAAKNINVRLADIRLALGAQSPKATAAIGKSIAGLIDQFDDVAKVEKVMRSIPKNQYLDDDEMRRQVGVGNQRWRDVRGHSRLAGYIFKLPNAKTVWMHAAAQLTLREAITLSQQ